MYEVLGDEMRGQVLLFRLPGESFMAWQLLGGGSREVEE